jgi:hypothetical protein
LPVDLQAIFDETARLIGSKADEAWLDWGRVLLGDLARRVDEEKAREERARLEEERRLEEARVEEARRLEEERAEQARLAAEARRLLEEQEAEAERQRQEDAAAEEALRLLMEGVEVFFAEDDQPAPTVQTTQKTRKRKAKRSPEVNDDLEIVETPQGSQQRPKPRMRKKASESTSTSQTKAGSSQTAEATSVKARPFSSCLCSSFLMQLPVVRPMCFFQIRDGLYHQTGGKGMLEV